MAKESYECHLFVGYTLLLMNAQSSPLYRPRVIPHRVERCTIRTVTRPQRINLPAERVTWMKSKLLLLAIILLLGTPAIYATSSSAKTSKSDVVTLSEGVLTIPTYQSPGRYLQPPLFPHSTLSGLYPFTTYEMLVKEGGPVPEKYPAVFVENKYLRLT